jgi:O-antigen ligase
MSVLSLLLLGIVLYTPYQIYLNISTGIPGINVLNLLALATLIAITQRPKLQGAPRTPLKWHFMLFFAALIAAFVMAVTRGGAPVFDDVQYLKSAIFYPLLFLLFYHGVRDLRTARLVYFGILFVAGVAALQAARQGLDYGLGAFNETRRASGPFSTTWQNANRAGVYFATFIPAFAVFALYMKERYRLLRLVAIGCTLLGIFATFVTYSRQAYFILALSLVLLFVRRSLLLVLLVLVAAINVEYWAPEAAMQRVQMTQQTSASGAVQLEESAESRFIIWQGAWDMIKEHPLGVGLNRFPLEIGNYSAIKGMDAHNGYILTAAEASVLTAAVLLLLLLRIGALSVPLLRSADAEARVLGWSLLLATIGVLLGNIYGSSFYFGEAMGNYWALAGMAARMPFLLAADAAAGRAAPGAVAARDTRHRTL